MNMDEDPLSNLEAQTSKLYFTLVKTNSHFMPGFFWRHNCNGVICRAVFDVTSENLGD